MQIPIEDLERLLPSSWITNYEGLHITPVPVQSTEAIFTQMKDNSTLITFKKPEEEGSNSFTTQFMMQAITPVEAEILSFDSNGNLQYTQQSSTGHNYWDVCFCSECLNLIR